MRTVGHAEGTAGDLEISLRGEVLAIGEEPPHTRHLPALRPSSLEQSNAQTATNVISKTSRMRFLF